MGRMTTVVAMVVRCRVDSYTDQGYGCDRFAVVPVLLLSSLAVSVRLRKWAAVGH